MLPCVPNLLHPARYATISCCRHESRPLTYIYVCIYIYIYIYIFVTNIIILKESAEVWYMFVWIIRKTNHKTQHTCLGEPVGITIVSARRSHILRHCSRSRLAEQLPWICLPNKQIKPCSWFLFCWQRKQHFPEMEVSLASRGTHADKQLADIRGITGVMFVVYVWLSIVFGYLLVIGLLVYVTVCPHISLVC